MMKSKHSGRGWAVGLIIAVTCTAASATSYQLTKIQVSGAGYISADDVNNRGQVVGSYGTLGVDAGHAYIYEGGILTTLAGPAGAVGVSAIGISDGGVIVGEFSTTVTFDEDGKLWSGPSQGYILQGGSYRVVNIPGAESTVLQGISPNSRFVTGHAVLTNGSHVGFVMDLDIDQTRIIGDPGPNSLTIVKGVNDAGLVLGDTRGLNGDGSQWFSGFSFDMLTGTMTSQNIAGAFRTAPREMNALGTQVGYYSLPGSSGSYRGFVGSVSEHQDLEYGSSYTLLRGINDAGWLTGSASDEYDSSYGLLLIPVPEPSSTVLLAGGLAAVGWRARRR